MDPNTPSATQTLDEPVLEVQELEDTTSDTAMLDGGNELSLESGDDVATLSSGQDTPPLSDTSSGIQGASSLLALQGIINRQSQKLDEARDQIKQVNESLKSILDNDSELSAVEEEVKQATRKQKERKNSLANSPESMQLKYKLKELREHMKDLEESLNNHLLNYYDMTKVKVIDTDDGGQREFTVRAKLLGKKQQ